MCLGLSSRKGMNLEFMPADFPLTLPVHHWLLVFVMLGIEPGASYTVARSAIPFNPICLFICLFVRLFFMMDTFYMGHLFFV